MSRFISPRLLAVFLLLPVILTGCTRDPNVRKQRFLESGNRYREQGKLREAAIQYANAVQIDPRFAEAHYQLGETYLKLKDYNRAYAELSRAVDLAPDNYTAQADLANLLISARQLKQAQPHLDVLHENSLTVPIRISRGRTSLPRKAIWISPCRKRRKQSQPSQTAPSLI